MRITRRRARRPASGPVACSIVGLLLATSVAYAQSSVAVLGVEPVDVPSAVAVRFSAALKEHVQRAAGYRLVPGKALEETKLVFGCMTESPGCMAKVGRSLSAALLLWGRVEGRKQGGLSLTLKVLDVAERRIRGRLHHVFSPGEAGAPEARVLALAATLLPPQAGTLRLRCAVEGAQVLIDGNPVGLVNARGVLVLPSVSLGTHQVEVRREGFRPFKRTIAVTAGQTVDLDAKLIATVPEPEVKPPDDGRATPPPVVEKSNNRLGWKIAFFSGAGATVGLGVFLLVNGLKVLSLADDKDTRIKEIFYADSNDPAAIALNNDGCSFASSTQFSDVHSLCQDGKDRAKLQTILAIVTGAVAAGTIAAGVIAFMGGADEKPERREDRDEVSRWRIIPSLGPDSAGLGFSLSF